MDHEDSVVEVDNVEYYSGKKKCHTIKDLLVIDETCHICFLSPTSAGKAHDKSLADLEGCYISAV